MTQRQKKRIEKLVQVLRSGKYRQCKTSLYKRNHDEEEWEYCILGLMALVRYKENKEMALKEFFNRDPYDQLADSILPKYYGIKDKTFEDLYALNDQHQYAFKDFADFFELRYLIQ